MDIQTTYAKAVDELSAKIFIPALICSLWVEFGSDVQRMTGFAPLVAYLLIFFAGLALAWFFLYSILYLSIYVTWFEFIPAVGVFLMPLGLAGLFPEQFKNLGIPYSQVTGLAILAWSFMLVRGVPFFRRLASMLE